jgi:hypothetical protein
MKRYDNRCRERVNEPRADAFLAELFAVYRKHGLALEHEDQHGGFLIEELSDHNTRWLNQAAIGTSFPEPPKSDPTPEPRPCGADDSVPYEYTTLGMKCQNPRPCPDHDEQGNRRRPWNE